MTIPDANALLLGSDPIPACATDSERALLEWATANPVTSPHPGMTKDGSRYSTPAPDGGKAKARTRVTTFAEALDDGQGLVRWRHRLLAHGLNLHRDQLGEVAPGDNAAADKVIGRALHDAGEKLKADIGTAIHLACEHHLAGTGIRPPAPWDVDVDAYAAMLAAHQLKAAMTEAVLWVPVGDGLCGTADLLVSGPWGDELRIVDIKTGSSAQRIGYATQLACYSIATHRWTEGGWSPLPAIDPSVAYIAHLPAGSGACELVAVTLDHGLVDLAAKVRDRRRMASVASMFSVVEPPPTLFDAPAAPEAEVQALMAAAVERETPALTDEAWIADADPEAMRAWFVGRVRTVSKGDNALTLSRRWPSGTSAKDPSTWTPAQMGELHELLATLETVDPPFAPSAPYEPKGWTLTELPPATGPSTWVVDEGDGPLDEALIGEVRLGFAALSDECRKLAASWAQGGKIGGRPWAVRDLTPRLLAVNHATYVALSSFWDADGAPDCDLLTRAALSLVIGEDVQPGWETGATLGALTIDQAQRLAGLARGFAASGEMGEELGAKALALSA